MRLTARQLTLATLDRQLLRQRARLAAVDAVERIVAIQAQEPASPYIALWTRVVDFDPNDLDRAFADRAVVKATLLRITLHAVSAADYPDFHDAMQPTLRAARLDDTRFTRGGLTPAEADAIIPALRTFLSEPRTNAEVDAWMNERLGEQPRTGVWWAYRQVGPFLHAPTGGPWSFGLRPAYVAAPERAPGELREALQTLIRRYLEGFGPATVADIGKVALIYRSLLREALDGIVDTLDRHEGPDGAELYDMPGARVPAEDTPVPPRFLPMWDSILLAYADRSRIIPPEIRGAIIRRNGDTLATVLVDGQVAGVWRPVEDGIEVTALRPIPANAWDALDGEARALRTFLADRDPTVYRRYARWWTTLDGVEVQVLGGGTT